MPSWFAGTWSTLPARIRWLVLVATLPAVMQLVHQARAHRMDAIAAESRDFECLQYGQSGRAYWVSVGQRYAHF